MGLQTFKNELRAFILGIDMAKDYLIVQSGAENLNLLNGYATAFFPTRVEKFYS